MRTFRTKYILSLLLGLAIFLSLSIFAKASSGNIQNIDLTNQDHLSTEEQKAEETEEIEELLFVYTPADYSENKKYTVLYILEGLKVRKIFLAFFVYTI